jgi:hypothetical protein
MLKLGTLLEVGVRKMNAVAVKKHRLMYPNVLKIIMATGFPGRKYPTINSVMTLRAVS